jgi:hypothetical protein
MNPRRLNSAKYSVAKSVGICCVVALVVLCPLSRVEAWGPHSEIADAAIAVLPSHDHARLIELLGDEARRLHFLVWMGDFDNQFITYDSGNEAAPAVFYANDYLVSPLAPRLCEHDPGGLSAKYTFTPFFLRTVQAMETETPVNAARWIGSLMHFQTDAGCPPHAAGLSGDVHSNMENWVVASAITISGYQPRLLGRNPDEAAKGFAARMAELIAFSRQRAERAYPFVIANDRPNTEPIVLESANETARVTADLLHTLLFLTDTKSGGSGAGGSRGELEACVTAATVPGFESLPAKLMIAGTNYSTTSELVTLDKGRYRGVFLLRNLRPGSYTVIVSRVGSRTITVDNFVIKPGSRTRSDWNLEPDVDSGNLVRNPDFQVRWLTTDPDNWDFDDNAKSWVTDNIKVSGGAKYRLQATPRDELPPEVSLQWYKNHWQAASNLITLAVGKTGGKMDITAPPNAEYARLYVKTRDDPARAVTHIALCRL